MSDDALGEPKMSTRLERNRAIISKLSKYIEDNPDVRFWQALRNISTWNYILVAHDKDLVLGDYKDTFYWEDLELRGEQARLNGMGALRAEIAALKAERDELDAKLSSACKTIKTVCQTE